VSSRRGGRSSRAHCTLFLHLIRKLDLEAPVKVCRLPFRSSPADPSGGHHTRGALTAASSMEHTFMMVLDHVGDQEAMVYAQRGQQPLARTTETSLEPR
jgi:hypothetical protein